MNRQEHLLTIIAEECAEVAQRASKASRFGLDEIQPGQEYDNRERILYEFIDLCGALELLNEGCIIEGMIADQRPRINAKKAKIEKFLAYSQECGTLQGPAAVEDRASGEEGEK